MVVGKVDSRYRQIVADWFSNNQRDLSLKKKDMFATLKVARQFITTVIFLKMIPLNECFR